jgi:hypothetical protein
MEEELDIEDTTPELDIEVNTTELDKEIIAYTNEFEIKDKTIHQLGTEKFIESIKNPKFKANIMDIETNQVVNSIYLVKKTKLGRTMSTMVWQFFRHRGKLDVNKIIKQYSRENLIINYKIFQ